VNELRRLLVPLLHAPPSARGGGGGEERRSDFLLSLLLLFRSKAPSTRGGGLVLPVRLAIGRRGGLVAKLGRRFKAVEEGSKVVVVVVVVVVVGVGICRGLVLVGLIAGPIGERTRWPL